MKKAIIPTAILCTAVCLGLHTQSNRAEKINPTPEPIHVAGDMVYVPGFGWFESQGEGTVTYDENMHENGNKVGIMG